MITSVHMSENATVSAHTNSQILKRMCDHKFTKKYKNILK